MTPIELLRSLLADSWAQCLAGSTSDVVAAHVHAAELLSDGGTVESLARLRVAHNEWRSRCLALAEAVTRIVAGQPVDFDALGRENTTATVVAVRILAARHEPDLVTLRGHIAVYPRVGMVRLGGADDEPWLATTIETSDEGKAMLEALAPIDGCRAEIVIRRQKRSER